MAETPSGASETAAQPTTEATTTPPETGQGEVEKWKALARQNEKQAKDNAAAAKRLAEIEESQKTETQKLTDAQQKAEARASDAELRALRLEVALDKAPEGVTLDVIRQAAKRLTGTTREELEADADELFPIFAPEPEATPEPVTEVTTTARPKPVRSGSQPVVALNGDALLDALKRKVGAR